MIYQICNPITFQNEYYVPDQATIDAAPKLPEQLQPIYTIGSEENAQNRLNEILSDYLKKEESRFHIGLTEINGNDQIWRNAIDTDPEIGTYQVFNHNTGTYTSYQTLTEAKNANAVLQQEFIESTKNVIYKILEELPKGT